MANVTDYFRREAECLTELYGRFFAKRSCTDFFIPKDIYSVFDAVVISADTVVNIEHKVRYAGKDTFDLAPVTRYSTAILEQDKFNNLKKLDKAALYVQVLSGYTFIWDLTPHFVCNLLQVGVKTCPVTSYGETRMKDKQVYYLPFNKADWIINNRTYERITSQEYVDHLQLIKDEQDRWLNNYFEVFK